MRERERKKEGEQERGGEAIILVTVSQNLLIPIYSTAELNK